MLPETRGCTVTRSMDSTWPMYFLFTALSIVLAFWTSTVLGLAGAPGIPWE